MTQKLFDKLMKEKMYEELLQQIPEDERVIIIKSIKEITEKFEREIYEPLKNYLGK